jgi:hypothetical protein
MAPHLHLEIVKSWPLGDSSNRLDVLRELAAGGIVVQPVPGEDLPRLALTGRATDYSEARLRVAKAYGMKEDPSAGATTKPVRWPLYVGIGAVSVTVLLLTWGLARRRK